jgi:hypothetical protein
VLPLELEYRLVGRDLVLVDVHANMVVDLLDLAPPASVDSLREGPSSPESDETPSWEEEEERGVPLDEEFRGCVDGNGY